MTAVVLEIAGGRSAFAPGETLSGAVQWELDDADRGTPKVEVRLIWFTRGKGTQDVEIVHTITFDTPPRHGQRPFQFNLPDSPHSFSGHLVSLTWALEAIAGGESARVEFVLSPWGAEIDLTGAGAKSQTEGDA